MKKQVATIANKKSYAEFLKEQLDIFFHDHADIHAYAVDDLKSRDKINEEIVVLSSYTIYLAVKSKMPKDVKLQNIHPVISQRNIDILKEAVREEPFETACYVNIDYRTTMSGIMELNEAGFHNIDFIPYYPGCSEVSETDVAVTPSEMSLIPPGMRRIIDIGERVPDLSNILELAEKLGVKDVFGTKQAREYRNQFLGAKSGVEKIFTDGMDAISQTHALIEYISEGMIITDLYGTIYLANRMAQKMLGQEVLSAGFDIQDVLPGLSLGRMIGDEEVVSIDGENYIVSVSAMEQGSIRSGYIISVQSFNQAERKQHRIRNRVYGGNHDARFHFWNIIGSSKILKEKIQIAKRLARSDASILITGESGTGKEVFAQSIHNASDRKNYSFVAINCAAIPENLFESELFGYEEGAFSGAKKGGKPGYLEIAHRGTIFLDEIGEMPLAMQGKLLRAIEERRISRVGSYQLIDIDVRFIAATNQDLERLIEGKQFRSDLFFRLNVLPLEIPPLRERKKDILELVDFFRTQYEGEWVISDAVKEHLMNYRWPGNVRELRNVVQYIDSLNQTAIGMQDLPRLFGEKGKTASNYPVRSVSADNSPREKEYIGFLLREGCDPDLYYSILNVMDEKNCEGKRVGRQSLTEMLQRAGNDYTETEIRTALRKLAEGGFIRTGRGRGGSRILRKGELLKAELKRML